MVSQKKPTFITYIHRPPLHLTSVASQVAIGAGRKWSQPTIKLTTPETAPLTEVCDLRSNSTLQPFRSQALGFCSTFDFNQANWLLNTPTGFHVDDLAAGAARRWPRGDYEWVSVGFRCVLLKNQIKVSKKWCLLQTKYYAWGKSGTVLNTEESFYSEGHNLKLLLSARVPQSQSIKGNKSTLYSRPYHKHISPHNFQQDEELQKKSQRIAGLLNIKKTSLRRQDKTCFCIEIAPMELGMFR